MQLTRFFFLVLLGCQGSGPDVLPPGLGQKRPSSFTDAPATSVPVPQETESDWDCWSRAISCHSGDVCEAPTHAVDLRCSPRSTCIQSGWQPESFDCAPSPTCEKTPDEILGTACTDEPGSVCAYNHIVCGCSPNSARDDEQDPDQPRPGTYACAIVAPRCPHVRPRIGGSCVTDMKCDYGAGKFSGGYLVSCISNVWQLELEMP